MRYYGEGLCIKRGVDTFSLVVVFWRVIDIGLLGGIVVGLLRCVLVVGCLWFVWLGVLFVFGCVWLFL